MSLNPWVLSPTCAHPPALLPPQLPGPLTEASWRSSPSAWLSLYNVEGTSAWGRQGSLRAAMEGVSGDKAQESQSRATWAAFQLNTVHTLGAVEGRQAQGQPGCI